LEPERRGGKKWQEENRNPVLALRVSTQFPPDLLLWAASKPIESLTDMRGKQKSPKRVEE